MPETNAQPQTPAHAGVAASRGGRVDLDALLAPLWQWLEADSAILGRYEPDGTATFLINWRREGIAASVAGAVALGGKNLVTLVAETGRPARIDDYADASGPIGEISRHAGNRSGVATPIEIKGRLWGVLAAASVSESGLPADTQSRLAGVAQLVAIAIANAEDVAALEREQSALRRVATLIAQGVAQEQLFAAVTEEAGRLLGAASVHLGRYEPDDAVTVLGAWGAERLLLDVGMRMPLGGHNITTLVAQTGRSARVDDYGQSPHLIDGLAIERRAQAAVGEPIVVEARVWGLLVALTDGQGELPQDAGQRLASFTELIAVAIANADSRASQARLADEQAALRRVATLVAQGVAQEQLFAAVTEEAGRLLGVTWVHLGRYNPDNTTTAVGSWGTRPVLMDVGTTVALGGNNLATIIAQTAAAAKLASGGQTDSELDRLWRPGGLESAVGEPILVEGGLWGWISAATAVGTPLPPGTTERLASFAELVATAIANAEGRRELNASRARIVAAADEARQRIERDLHDGAQQDLVHAVIGLKLALRGLRNGDAGATEMVAEALRHAEDATADLRELAHGILPAVLTSGGLRAGSQSLVSRLSLPVRTEVTDQRFPAAIEATGYFVMSEALTNVAKHADATGATISAEVEGDQLKVEVADDGVGGARVGPARGLGGLQDRVAAMGGRLEVVSPPGRGTMVRAWLPAASSP